MEFGYPYCVCGRTIVCVKHTTQLKFTSPTIPNMEFSPHFFSFWKEKPVEFLKLIMWKFLMLKSVRLTAGNTHKFPPFSTLGFMPPGRCTWFRSDKHDTALATARESSAIKEVLKMVISFMRWIQRACRCTRQAPFSATPIVKYIKRSILLRAM